MDFIHESQSAERSFHHEKKGTGYADRCGRSRFGLAVDGFTGAEPIPARERQHPQAGAGHHCEAGVRHLRDPAQAGGPQQQGDAEHRIPAVSARGTKGHAFALLLQHGVRQRPELFRAHRQCEPQPLHLG